MALGELLQKHADAIVAKWLEAVLAMYGDASSAAFAKQKDPFANPVGHSLRVATRGIFDVLVDEMDPEKIHRHLNEVVRIRAVQEFSASQAVSFVFRLKEVLRAELPEAVADPRLAGELAEIEARIDWIALAAFDIYVECRERVCELRVKEMKRQVSWVMDRMNRRDAEPDLAPSDPE